MTIGVVHPGAMGAAIGGVLAGAGHDVVWAAAGRSDATARRAADAGLRAVAEAGAALQPRSDVVLSVCPPDPHSRRRVRSPVRRGLRRRQRDRPGHGGEGGGRLGQATSTAASSAAAVRAPRGCTWRRPGAGGGGAVRRHRGGRARARAGGPADGGVRAQDGYAAWTKGSAALLLAIEEVARGLDVDDALREEWALSQPELAERLAAARTAAASKGWRWTGEMREIAETFEAAGQPGGFGRAAAEVYER